LVVSTQTQKGCEVGLTRYQKKAPRRALLNVSFNLS
jgi:hypothetical protein